MLYACDELLEIRYIVSPLLHTYHIAQNYGSKSFIGSTRPDVSVEKTFVKANNNFLLVRS